MASISAGSSVKSRNCTHSGVPSPRIQTSSDGSCPRCRRMVWRYERRINSMESMSVPSRSKRKVERCTPEGNFDGRKRHAQFPNRPHSARRRHLPGTGGASARHSHARGPPRRRRARRIAPGASRGAVRPAARLSGLHPAAAVSRVPPGVVPRCPREPSPDPPLGRRACPVRDGRGRLGRPPRGPEVENTISLLSGYAAYLPAERLGVSGILAVVATGLHLGRVGPRFVAADTRVQNVGMWDVVVFVLEGLIFIITGLALRPILGGWSGPFARHLVWAAVLVSLTVIVARFVWVFPATYLPRFLSPRVRKRDPYPPW